MKSRIAVIGASGFVGSTLVELLEGNSEIELVPFIHRAGSAARLARGNIAWETLDILDGRAVERALASFDAVVNCSRGGADVMLKGLDNLLHAVRRQQSCRFIHLSSVAIYGDPPHPDSIHESAPARPAPGTYGALKLQQDDMVQKAAAGGLQAVILCPPNITGPYSSYLTDLVDSIEFNRFRLLDDGKWSVSTVDVRNLSEAIFCAVQADKWSGERYFVSEDEPFTWMELCSELAPLCRSGIPVPSISSARFKDEYGIGNAPATARSRSALKHLMSDEVRAALRQNPKLAAIEKKMRHGAELLGKPLESRLQRAVSGPIVVQKASLRDPLNVPLVAQQLRNVKHSSARARAELGFQPRYSIHQSFADFRSWYESMCDGRSEEWKLLVNR